jgi:hypothetical protein
MKSFRLCDADYSTYGRPSTYDRLLSAAGGSRLYQRCYEIGNDPNDPRNA